MQNPKLYITQGELSLHFTSKNVFQLIIESEFALDSVNSLSNKIMKENICGEVGILSYYLACSTVLCFQLQQVLKQQFIQCPSVITLIRGSLPGWAHCPWHLHDCFMWVLSRVSRFSPTFPRCTHEMTMLFQSEYGWCCGPVMEGCPIQGWSCLTPLVVGRGSSHLTP